MERREFIALLGAATAMIPSSTQAESLLPWNPSADKLFGAWGFASSVNTRKDGTPFDRWGANPKGILMFDRGGHYAQIIMGSESRVFGSKVFCAFGTFTIDEANNLLTTTISGCSVPKLSGVVQKRAILLLTPNELKYSNPTTATGTNAEVLWKRMT
jgi:lipocalin-like protein